MLTGACTVLLLVWFTVGAVAPETEDNMPLRLLRDPPSVPDCRLFRAEAESSPISCRSSGTAMPSFFTGITYTGSPSSAISTCCGRENRPPVAAF